MAWFGDGLSKLRGELSNLTRDLSETLSPEDDASEEVGEEAIGRIPSNDSELEAKLKDDKLERLKKENDLLRKRINDEILSLDQASPRSHQSFLSRSYQSAADDENWGDFEDDPITITGGVADFEFDSSKQTSKSELTFLKEKIDMLEKENEDLIEKTSELPDLRSRIKQLNKENNLLIKSIEKLERDDEDSKRLVDTLKESKRDTDKKNEALIEEIKELKGKLKSAVNSNASASTESTSADNAIQTEPELPGIEPCQTGSDNSDELSEAYDMLQNEYDDLKQKFDEVVKKTKNDTGNKIDFEVMPNYQDYTEKIKSLNEQVIQLKHQEQEFQRRIEDLEIKLHQKIEDEKSICFQVEEKIIEINQLASHNQYLQTEIEILKEKQRDFDELHHENENSNDLVAENKILNETNNELQEAIDKLKVELENMKIVLKQKEDEIEEWGNNDDWGTGNNEEVNKLKEKNIRLSENLKEKEEIVTKLLSSTESLEKMVKEKVGIEDNTEEINTLKNENKKLIEDLDAVKELLKQKEAEIVEWGANNTGVLEQFNSIEKENISLKEKLSELESTVIKLKSHSESLQKTLLEKEMEVGEWGNNDNEAVHALEEEKKILCVKISEQDTLVAELRSKIEYFENTLKEKEKENDFDDWGDNTDWGSGSLEVNKLKEENKKLIEENEKLNEKLDEIEEENAQILDSLRDEGTQLKEKLSEQQKIIIKLKKQMEKTPLSKNEETVSGQTQQADDRIEVLSQENESLRTRVEQLSLVIENNYVNEPESSFAAQETVNERNAQLLVDKEKLEEELKSLTNTFECVSQKLDQAIQHQKDLEEEIKQLEDDNNNLREQLEGSQSIGDLKSEIQKQQEIVNNSEVSIHNLLTEKKTMEEEFKILQGKYNELGEKVKDRTDADKLDRDTLIKNLQSKEEELCKLLDEKTSLDNIKLEKENLEVQLDNLNTNYQDKINHLIQTNSNMELKISELNNSLHNKNNELNDMNKRLSLFEENNAFLQRTVVDLERNLDEKVKEFNDKEIKYNENTEAITKRLDTLREKNEKLISQVENCQIVKSDQTSLFATPSDSNLLAENEHLKCEVERLREEERENTESLQNAMRTLEILSNQVSNRDAEIKSRTVEIQELIEKVKWFENKCNELEKTIEAKLHDFSTKEEINRSKMVELNKMFESLQEENNHFKLINDELKTNNDVLKQHSNERGEEKELLDKHKKELEKSFAVELEQKVNLVGSLETQLKEMQEKMKTYEHIENELVQYRNQIAQLEQAQSVLMTERTQWIHEFEIKNNTIQDLQKQIEHYFNNLNHSNTINSDLIDVKNQVKELENDKQDLLKQIQTESISTNFIRNELQMLKEELTEMKTKHETLQVEKNKLNERANILETQYKEICEKLNIEEVSFSQKLEESDTNEKKLRNEISELQNEIKKRDEVIINLNETNNSISANESIEQILKEKDVTLVEMIKKCEAKDEKLQELQRTMEKHLSEKYQFEKESLDLKNNLISYDNQIKLLNSTTSDLQYRLQEKEEMIKELNEMKQSFFIGDSKDTVRFSDEEHIEELRELQLMNESLQNELQNYATEVHNMKETISHLETYNQQLQQQQRNQPDTNPEFAIIRAELAEQRTLNQQLISTVQMKHTESVNYHNEIQRLNGVLSEELTKIKQDEKQIKAQNEIIETKEKLLKETQDKLSLAQAQLEELSQMASTNIRPEAEGEPAPEPEIVAQHVQSLESNKERNDLANRVQVLQDEKALLLSEINDLRLNQNNMYSENERLKQHLMTIEEEYTQELVKSETNVQDLTQKLREADERVKSSATAYTSASVRSNQQVESLSSQVKYLTEQKEKLQEKLNAAEELLGKHQSSLTNLEIVLEQFQADKENEIQQGIELLQGELDASYAKNNELGQQISLLQRQLQDAMASLSAAGRLSEQLEQKTDVNRELTEKVNHLTEQLTSYEVKLKEVNNNGKVDKCLVNNMIVNFLTAPSRPSRHQALQVLASVIEMTSQDRQRIGLEPTASFSPNQSLSEAFIQFLENESTPKLKSQSSTPASRRTSSTTSPLIFPESALPNIPQFPLGRSSGSILKDALQSDS